MRKVYIVDSNYPKDHYYDRADGQIAQHILKALGIRADLRLAFDRKLFEKAILRAMKARCDVLHISTHGDEKGIAICNDVRQSKLPQGFLWKDFVELFQGEYEAPKALVMSACNGAAPGLAHAFEQVSKRPGIIIGSTDKRSHSDYVAAWSLLYRRFEDKGIERGTARRALRDIVAVVHNNFRYWRWDENKQRYLKYPIGDDRYRVSKKD